MPLKATGFVCCADNCEKAGYGPQNLCEMHRARLRRHGDPNTKVNEPAKGLTCSIAGCERPRRMKGLCMMHYTRKHRTGNAGEAGLRRSKFGSGCINEDGYHAVMINYQQKLVHRLVVERAMWKPLPAGTIVHHLNGIKTDNRHCNLVVCPNESYHKLLHRRQKELGYNGPEPIATPIHDAVMGQRSESSLLNGE